MDIKPAEDQATLDEREVRTTAKLIWPHVLMEVMDGLVYGCAVKMLSDVLITRDGAFIKTVNDLATSGEPHWRRTRMALQQSLGLPSTHRFPKAIRPQDPLPS